MAGSVAAGSHPDIQTAQKSMMSAHEKGYTPNPEATKAYDRLFSLSTATRFFRRRESLFNRHGRDHERVDPPETVVSQWITLNLLCHPRERIYPSS